MFGVSSYTPDDTLRKDNSVPTPYDDNYVSKVTSSSTGSTLVGLHAKMSGSASSSLKISALRSATALQKYKEIQNSNDPDFANQVLDRKSTRLNSSHSAKSRMPSSA